MPKLWDLYFQDENDEKTCALDLSIWVDANIKVCLMEERTEELLNWKFMEKLVQESIGDSTDLQLVTPIPSIAERKSNTSAQKNQIESKENEILTPPEISKILKISLTSTYDLLQKGIIPARKVGGQWRSTGGQISDYLEGKREMARKGSSESKDILRTRNIQVQKRSKVMGRRKKEGIESEETFIHR